MEAALPLRTLLPARSPSRSRIISYPLRKKNTAHGKRRGGAKPHADVLLALPPNHAAHSPPLLHPGPPPPGGLESGPGLDVRKAFVTWPTTWTLELRFGSNGSRPDATQCRLRPTIPKPDCVLAGETRLKKHPSPVPLCRTWAQVGGGGGDGASAATLSCGASAQRRRAHLKCPMGPITNAHWGERTTSDPRGLPGHVRNCLAQEPRRPPSYRQRPRSLGRKAAHEARLRESTREALYWPLATGTFLPARPPTVGPWSANTTSSRPSGSTRAPSPPRRLPRRMYPCWCARCPQRGRSTPPS